ncbi:hypothetical protein BDV10DRAFT_185260 [Aspergillus recurvatus]
MAPKGRDDYTVAWICALPLELAAACAMLDEQHEPPPAEPSSRDNNNYIFGRVDSHNVVVACLPYGVTGTISAARVANLMLATFTKIRFGLMIGIGGGAPSEQHDIRLGDVVVGSPRALHGGVIQYDFGKTLQHGRFQRIGMLNKPPKFLLAALSNLQARHYMQGHRIEDSIGEMVAKYPLMRLQYTRPPQRTDRLYEAGYEHPEDQPTCASCDSERVITRAPRPSDVSQPYIHYGLIASGDQVVRNGQMRDQLRDELGVLCFEMEAAGLIDSLPCLVIRGVSDYADSHKNDVWQGYAAATAAAYVRELMRVIPAWTEHPRHTDWGVDNGRSPFRNLPTWPLTRPAAASDVRFRVQEWLSPASFRDDLYNHQKECMDGSCDWALEKREIKTFLASKESQILRVGGAPGIGKSTLTAFLIRRIMDASHGHVIYFFCKDTTDSRSKPIHALRTLLSQVLAFSDDNRLWGLLERLRVESGQKHAKSFATLRSAFESALSPMKSMNLPLWVVIDALDECEDGHLLASTVADTLNASALPFKLLLTSREEPGLLDFFHHYKEQCAYPGSAELLQLTIVSSYVRRPVATYVAARVCRIQHIKDTPLSREVIREISAAADGLWLYARLMVDEIQHLPSAASVARHLQRIPSGLMDLYQAIFEAMAKALSPVELSLAQQLFLWIDLGDIVQVGRRELDGEILDIVFQAANSGEEVFDSIALAKSLCSPLITLKPIHKQTRSRTKATVRVGFVHYTAMQFVRQSAERQPPRPVATLLKPQLLKALHRAKTGMWYFEYSGKSTTFFKFLTQNKTRDLYLCVGAYFEMAYALWGAFFLQDLPVDLEDESLVVASALCNELSDFLLSGRCLKWVEMAIIINYDGGFTNLFYNAFTALNAARQSLNTPSSQANAWFRDFSIARMQFFADYAYVVSQTGPVDEKLNTAPEGFHSRHLAVELMRLGEKWAHLYT